MMKQVVVAIMLGGLAMPAPAHEGMDMGSMKKEANTAGGPITVKGEVLDMACYMDHGAQGEKHASCAKTCIESGLPVGLKAEDGNTYLLIGEHKPINAAIAPYAAKTVTIKGKLVSRDGLKMIENAEIVK